MDEKIEYPQIYKNEEGIILIALNDVQGAAFENQGFKPAGKYKSSKPKTEE